jgi:hypothetical protein
VASPLDIKFFMPYKGEDGHHDLWGFGDGKKAFFWITQGKPDPSAIHWGFVAENEDKVDEFYEAAMSAGARDHISPCARPEYYPGYYATDVFDPDGYSFEVVDKSGLTDVDRVNGAMHLDFVTVHRQLRCLRAFCRQRNDT